MGEGTFLTLLKFLAECAPDPVTAALARLAHRDEARHVAFGTEHLRYVLEREPEKRLRGHPKPANENEAWDGMATERRLFLSRVRRVPLRHRRRSKDC
jgi:hypothetical protein